MVSVAFMVFRSRRPLTYNNQTHVMLGVILTLCLRSKRIVAVIIGVRTLKFLEIERVV